MTTLPQNDDLDVAKLSSVFSDTTNSYKFYWFLSILDSLQENDNTLISYNDIAVRMIANVWYPLNYFKLSFGKQDGFKQVAEFVNDKIKIDDKVNSLQLFSQIYSKMTEEELKELSHRIRELLRWVPYRFIRPYFSEETRGFPDHQVNNKIVELCNQNFENNSQKVIYRFHANHIELNQNWIQYFNKHQIIIRGFIFWHLIKFLQKNNPNVVGLSEKLEKPQQRNLKQANTFWKDYLKENSQLKCIYTGQDITVQNMSLDHFLPWSFVVHDKIWNIIPTPQNINSSKNNWLPSTEHYIDSFINTQFKAFRFHLERKNSKLLEDYTLLFGMEENQMKDFKEDDFSTILKKQILPQIQMAKNMGFNYPFIYQNSL